MVAVRLVAARDPRLNAGALVEAVGKQATQIAEVLALSLAVGLARQSIALEIVDPGPGVEQDLHMKYALAEMLGAYRSSLKFQQSVSPMRSLVSGK